MLTEWIRRGLAKPGKTQRGLARALGLDPAGVNRLVHGRRQIKVGELAATERYLEEPAPPEIRTLAEDVAPLLGDAPRIDDKLMSLYEALGGLLRADEVKQAAEVAAIITVRLKAASESSSDTGTR